MATLEDLDDLEREEKDERKEGDDGDGGRDRKTEQNGDAVMVDGDDVEKEARRSKEILEEEERRQQEEALDPEILNSSTRDITARRRLLENDTRIMKSEFQRLSHEKASMNDKIKDNHEKIENNR